MTIKLVINIPDAELRTACQEEGMTVEQFKEEAREGFPEAILSGCPVKGVTCSATIED